MVSNQNYTRIDTSKLKSLITRKIGHRRAENYFDHLSRLFSLKISKCEFDKLCFNTIGRENIPLHNRLIRSIVKNACLGKVPPARGSENKSGGALKRGFQSVTRDAFPSSPRKAGNRGSKFRDRPSPLGESPTELLSLGSRPPVEVASVEDGEEVEQAAGSPSVGSRSPVTAPLGISLCGARKSLSNVSAGSHNLPTCQNSGELPHTKTLKTRLEQKLEKEGIAVSMDCINLLNNGLDAYMRRLIEPCLSLRRNENTRPINHPLAPGFNGTLVPKPVCVSFLDFRVSMEMNPRLLGEDWPIQLEKISLHAHEE